MAGPVVESVNVGRPRAVPWRGQTVVTAIWKAPVAGRVPVRGVNVDGDEQGNPEVHGGVDKAVYAYAGEDADWWAEQLRREVGPGSFGENLTTRGLDVTGAVIGERWRAGSVLLEVSSPRIPCVKLGIRMGSQQFPRRFAAAGRPGAYLRVLADGEVAAGDPVPRAHRRRRRPHLPRRPRPGAPSAGGARAGRGLEGVGGEPGGGTRGYGRASSTRLNGVSAARRTLPKPASASSSRRRASGTWLPSAGLTPRHRSSAADLPPWERSHSTTSPAPWASAMSSGVCSFQPTQLRSAPRSRRYSAV